MEPKIEISEDALRAEGFTPSGVKRYCATVSGYAEALYKKALAFGNASKGKGLPREVSHEQVRSAAASIGNQAVPPTGWQVAGRVGEYLATAIAGVGAGHLDVALGILLFGVGTAGAVLLVIIRLTNRT